jgi:hypothetical protein
MTRRTGIMERNPHVPFLRRHPAIEVERDVPGQRGHARFALFVNILLSSCKSAIFVAAAGRVQQLEANCTAQASVAVCCPPTVPNVIQGTSTKA